MKAKVYLSSKHGVRELPRSCAAYRLMIMRRYGAKRIPWGQGPHGIYTYEALGFALGVHPQ